MLGLFKFFFFVMNRLKNGALSLVKMLFHFHQMSSDESLFSTSKSSIQNFILYCVHRI